MISGAHFSGIKFIKICAQARQRGKLGKLRKSQAPKK